MTKKERREYQRKYRAEHKDQIKQSVERRKIEKFLEELDHFEGRRAYMKDGSIIEPRRQS